MDERNLPILGVDISDCTVEVCEIDADGEIGFRGKVPSTEKSFRAFFAKRSYRRVVLEAGTHSPWISRLLTELGQSVLVVNPRRLAAISQSSRKNDRNDAEMLARLARADERLLSPVRHRGVEAQRVVAGLRARDVLVRVRTKLINAVRGLAKPFGVRFPKCEADVFARRASEAIPPELAPVLGSLVEEIEQVTTRIETYEAELATWAEESAPETEVLRQVKGVGPLTSVAFVATVEDSTRFKRLRDIGPWLGLVPRQDQSGRVDKQLRITKTGDAFLRRLLVTSAHYILGPFGPDTDLRRHGLALAERGGKNGKKRAVVAVARKLAILLLSLWRSGEVYQPLRDEGATLRRPLHLGHARVTAPPA